MQKKSYLLAIETSCDENAAAILDYSGKVVADIVCSQVTVHAPYGGVVPEIASREHLVKITDVVKRSFAQANISSQNIEAVAVAYGPGLIGSLLVGAQFAKGFAQSLAVPLIGIHHIEGHLMAGMVSANFSKAPFIALIASGGHSALYEVNQSYNFSQLGDTRDDAAGEAFDKTAKLLGLGYPGGQIIDKNAGQGDPNIYQFPIALHQKSTLEYSFSGLKTSVRAKVQKLREQNVAIKGQVLNDICAGVQKAIVDALLNKAFLACKQHDLKTLVLGGGVCANSLLRSQAEARGQKNGVQVFLPPKKYCTDNAVMIGLAAYRRIETGQKKFKSVCVDANALLCAD